MLAVIINNNQLSLVATYPGLQINAGDYLLIGGEEYRATKREIDLSNNYVSVYVQQEKKEALIHKYWGDGGNNENKLF